MNNLNDTIEYSNINSENKSDADILILPPQNRRRGRIIIEANYKKSETQEDIKNRNEIVLKIILRSGLNNEIKNLNEEDI